MLLPPEEISSNGREERFRLELEFSGDIIKGITISPPVKSDLVEQSIQDFTTYCNLPISDYSTFIRKSKVPVRF